MNSLSIVLVLALFAAIVSSAPPAKYSSKYDSVDVDKILSNDRVLTTYINCMLDKGPCTPEGREFRRNLPEALTTQCQKCTNGQKKMIKKATRYIMENRKPEWEQIRKKYDPKGAHVESFRKFLSEP